MTDLWGSPGVLDMLRMVFRGQELPADAKPEDILFYVNQHRSNTEGAWCPIDVQFVGPGSPSDGLVRRDRVTVVFGVIADGRRVIEDFSVG